MFRMVEPDPGAIRPAWLHRRELGMGTETGHAAGVPGGGAGDRPQVGVACRTRAIGDHRERIRVLMLAVAVHAVRFISGYCLVMMHESRVAAGTGLVHGQVGAFLIVGDEAAEWLPGSDVAILADESFVDLGDRAGCMDSMVTEQNIIGNPTEREDQGDDASDRRTMCGDPGDDPSDDASHALVPDHAVMRPLGPWVSAIGHSSLSRCGEDRRIATQGRPKGRRQ
jgi:hypothetical protein